MSQGALCKWSKVGHNTVACQLRVRPLHEMFDAQSHRLMLLRHMMLVLMLMPSFMLLKMHPVVFMIGDDVVVIAMTLMFQMIDQLHHHH